MDGDAPRDRGAGASDQAANKRAAKPRTPAAARPKAPAWVDALPATIDFTDELATTATLGHAAVSVALARVLADPFLKIRERVAMITQLTAQMPAMISKRRLWEAERLVRGEAQEMEAGSTGPKLEHASDVEQQTNGDREARGPTPRRGRPRKRPLL